MSVQDNDLFDNDWLPEEEKRRPGPIATVMIILLVLAILTTLIWPLLVYGPRSRSTPTPTPAIIENLQTV